MDRCAHVPTDMPQRVQVCSCHSLNGQLVDFKSGQINANNNSAAPGIGVASNRVVVTVSPCDEVNHTKHTVCEILEIIQFLRAKVHII